MELDWNVKRMRNRIGQWAALAWTAAVLVAGLVTAAAQEPSPVAAGALERGFRNPPDEARPSAYYLMLNGYLNRDHVGRELEIPAMRRGVELSE